MTSSGRTRRTLDSLYLGCAYLAAACLAGIALVVVAQMIGRVFGVAIDSTESAGFLLAGSTFFALAHTFREGEHIRVTLLTRLAGGRAARWLELWALGATLAMVGYATWWSIDFVWFSWVYGEISPGLLAIPFWIPRSAMALGLALFALALADELVAVWRGGVPSYAAKADDTAGATAGALAAPGSAASIARGADER